MAEISKITLPSGTTYDIKDTTARQMASAGALTFVVSTDAASTPKDVTWDDHGTTVTGTLVASADTKSKFYLVPATTASGKDVFAEYVTIQDNSTYGWEKIGTTDIDISNLGDLAYKDTASGNYTPSGSVSAPTISVSSAGSTATIHNPTKTTVATAVVASAPGETAPSNPLTYYSVSNETLSLYQLGYNTGDSISTSDITVKTGDASYSASAPSFTGTEGSVTVS